MNSKSLPLYLTVGLLLFSQFTFAQWQTVGGAAISGGPAPHISLAIAKNDTVLVGYRDNGAFTNGGITVSKYNPGTNSWASLGNAAFSPSSVSEVSLATDSATRSPYAAYIDSVAGLAVTQYNGTSWAFLGGTGFTSSSHPDEISLLIAGNGTPYIGYRDGNSSNKANMMKYSGGSWVQVGNPNFSTSANVVVFAMDHHGNPYMAASLTSSQGIEVQKFDGTNWVFVGTTRFDTAYNASKISLAIGANNEPYVALTEMNSPNQARVWTFNGATWVQAGGDVTTGHAQGVALTVSKQGIPILAYDDNTNNSKATVSYLNGSTWSQLGNADFSAGTAEYLSVAVNSLGVAYVAYQDDANGYEATVQKYSYITGINETVSASDMKLYPNPNNGKFHISLTSAEAGEVQISVINMMGQTMWQDSRNMTNGNESIDVSSLAKGLYTLQVKSNSGTDNRLVEIQ